MIYQMAPEQVEGKFDFSRRKFTIFSDVIESTWTACE